MSKSGQKLIKSTFKHFIKIFINVFLGVVHTFKKPVYANK